MSLGRSMGRLVGMSLAFALGGIAGCGTGVGVGGGGQRTPDDDSDPITRDVVDGNQDPSVSSSFGKTSGEPNDSFVDAIAVVFDADGVALLQGMIATTGDLDVYRLGALLGGDRLTVDAETTGSVLDVSIAVFDGSQRLVYNNDDRGGMVSRFLDSYLQWTVRHEGNPYYLVVTNSPFAAMGQTTGSYEIEVTFEGGFDVPAPTAQTLILDFDGGRVNSPTLGNIVIEPFDASAISSVYRRQDDALQASIRATVEQNFARFNVTVVTSDDPPVDGDNCSTVFFGGFNPSAFGISESVDLYNVDFCDDAIIYTESFSPQVFTLLPTAEALGVAIGNVAAHEAGHLLGLNHVDDDWALMDDQSPADAFMEDQEFKEAPLSTDIMPIGTQDAVLLLDEIVGQHEECVED